MQLFPDPIPISKSDRFYHAHFCYPSWNAAFAEVAKSPTSHGKEGQRAVGRDVIQTPLDKTAKVVPGEFPWRVHYAFFARHGFTPEAQALAAAHGARLQTLAQVEACLLFPALNEGEPRSENSGFFCRELPGNIRSHSQVYTNSNSRTYSGQHHPPAQSRFLNRVGNGRYLPLPPAPFAVIT
jgi:hypothetical protein